MHELNLAYDPCEVAPDDDFHACVRTSEGHKTQTFHKTEPYKHILIIDSNATIKAEKPVVAVIVMGLWVEFQMVSPTNSLFMSL